MFRSNFDYGEGFYSNINNCNDPCIKDRRMNRRKMILQNIIDSTDVNNLDFAQDLIDPGDRNAIQNTTPMKLLPIDAVPPDDGGDDFSQLINKGTALGILNDSFSRKESEQTNTPYHPGNIGE